MNHPIPVKPTAEQQQAIDMFQIGSSLKINAYAGTGKTATLVMLARSTRRQGTYLAFNRSLADEARIKFPTSVMCRTTHQLAYHDTPGIFRCNRDKMFGTINANYVATRFRLEKMSVNKQCILSPRQQGAMILETLRKFQQSADCMISKRYVPVWGKLEDLPETDLEPILKYAKQHAGRLWEAMIDPSDPVPLGHDGYYKLWALSHPVIPGDYIMVDESQDTNGAMLGVLKQQHAQMVYVGDRYQQIYQWRGAINAMSSVTTDHQTNLTRSFRFGPLIAMVASKVLSLLGETRQVLGNTLIESRLGCRNPFACLSRTNSGVINLMIKALSEGKRPYVIGGHSELVRLLTAVTHLKSGIPVDLPEFFGFNCWGDVVEFSNSEEGSDLKTLVNLVETYGEHSLLASLNKSSASEADASMVISTVHRAKGREWPSVFINDDFHPVSTDQKGWSVIDPAELRLLYVAMTRAQLQLQLPSGLLILFRI